MDEKTYKRLTLIMTIILIIGLWFVGYSTVTKNSNENGYSMENESLGDTRKNVKKQATAIYEGEIIDINHADRKELDKLPDIGPQKADAIVVMREKMHGFYTIEDLLCVRGIGEKTLQKIRKYIKVNEY